MRITCPFAIVHECTDVLTHCSSERIFTSSQLGATRMLMPFQMTFTYR